MFLLKSNRKLRLAGRLFAVIGAAMVLNTSTWGSESRSIQFQGIEGELLDNVRANATLSVLAQKNQLDQLTSNEWQRLRRAVRPEIREALEPFGYYQVEISANHSGDALSYSISLGEPVRLDTVSVNIDGPASALEPFRRWRKEFPLQEGDVLRQMDYESAKSQLLAMTSRLGFFDARLVRREILIAKNRTRAELHLTLESGPRYSFGETRIRWHQDRALLEERVLRPHLNIKPSDPYDADRLAATRSGLQSTPYFSSVEVRPDLDSPRIEGEAAADNQLVPIDVLLTAAKRHTYNFAIGAGTDTGLRVSVGYENRRLNRRGHRLNTRIGASEIRETAILNYRIPLSTSARDSVNFLLSREEEQNDFRTFTVSKLGAELARQWHSATLNFGLTASREKFLVGADEQTTDLVLPSIGWEKIVSDDPYFPTFGWSADVTLRGGDESFGSDIDLTQIIADGKAVLSVGRGRVLARVRAAGTRIDDALELPASLGFLTGGDRSVRGYRYESIGVPLGSPEGRGVVATRGDQQITVGRHLVAASIEYEHPLKDQFAVAAFVDAGDAFNRRLDLKRGVGVGLRWRLPFGSLKADIASALDRDGSPLRLHLSFGSDL